MVRVFYLFTTDKGLQLKMYYGFVSVNCIAVFYHFVIVYIKNNDTVVKTKLFCKFFNSFYDIFHQSVAVRKFIYRILQAYCSVFCRLSSCSEIVQLVG